MKFYDIKKIATGRGHRFAKPRVHPLCAEVPWNDKRWPPCGRTSEHF